MTPPEGDRRWAAALLRVLAAAEDRLDTLRYRTAGHGRLAVVAYRGYGSRERLWVKGRAIREPRLPAAAAGDRLWRNVLATWRRFESDEVPGARVRVSAAGAVVEVEADDEGYFEAWLVPVALPPAGGHVAVELELLAPASGERVHCATEVIVPPPSARLFVISDVDDTVVPTGAGRLLRMARNLVAHNAHSRVPFPGVAALYRALAAGTGAEGNPFLYVSSGPWNLYDLLLEAFRLHGLPAGPLLLRDWGLTPEQWLPTRHHDHKLAAIRQVLAIWPELPFLLVGDSGQADPEIYRDIAAEHGSRVLAVYIRDVGRHPDRPAAIARLAEEVSAAGSTLLLAPTAWELARHAADRRWITADALPAVAAALGRDLPPAS